MVQKIKYVLKKINLIGKDKDTCIECDLSRHLWGNSCISLSEYERLQREEREKWEVLQREQDKKKRIKKAISASIICAVLAFVAFLIYKSFDHIEASSKECCKKFATFRNK